jgi:hypothetical protein
MSSSVLSSGLLSSWSEDWDDLSGLERIVAAYQVAENSVVVETDEGREIRITAWRDLSTGDYVAEFERRGLVAGAGHECRAWVHTPAYRRCVADELEACLEAAILEVDRIHVN